MGGFAKDMIQEHARIAGLCLKKEHGHPVLCNACYFEADDEDKKIYGKHGERTIKQVP
jgi:hypothetical protein